jgi:DNA-binding LytR/AlgR family response regulator
MNYMIAGPDMQSGIELKEILDGCGALDFQGSFPTFQAAENHMFRHLPDLAFLWIGKAELNSFRLAGEIKRRSPKSKIVFIGDRREDAVQAFEQGADGFLLAPFNKQKIAQLLDQITGKK